MKKLLLMGKKIRTTVVLTAKAETILMKYRNTYGLKAPLSIGLEEFDRMAPEVREKEVNRVEAEDEVQRKAMRAQREEAAAAVESGVARARRLPRQRRRASGE